jgi:MYB-CC type transfactor, LHEQLE motif
LFQVQKHVQIRIEAHQKYMDTLLEKACKVASEQIGFNATEPELPQLTGSAPVMYSQPDPLSPSMYHQLSVGSINLHSPTGTGTKVSTGIEGQFIYQKPPELKRKSC